MLLVRGDENYSAGLIEKLDKLGSIMAGIITGGVVVAFSGGTDSAMLLWAAQKVKNSVGGKLLAVTQDSVSLPRKDVDEAKEFANSLGVEHKLVKSHEFDNPDYLKNDVNRCYYCRQDLFRITGEIKQTGYKYVVYGYNHSDKGEVRPGHRAAIENNILSPLADCGFSKEEIRQILRKNNIEIADKPSTTCLSTRIMTGIEIDKQDIRNLEKLERILWSAGANIFRVRLCKEDNFKFLRIETSPEDLQLVIKNKDLLVAKGKELGYKWVTLDLEGYKLGGGTL